LPTPDIGLICAALRWPPGADRVAGISRAVVARPDWARDFSDVCRRAREHRVASQVFAALKASGSPDIPASCLDELRCASFADARSALMQVAEISRLLAALRMVDVPVLVLKGVALSVQLFGDVSRRRARDIDLLVAPADRERADAVLRTMGYRSERWSAADQAAVERCVKDAEYFHATTLTCVELHTRLTDNADLLAWGFAMLWREREEVTVGETVIPTLPRHRLAVYLCVHGASHGWERLRWLADLAALLADATGTSAAIAAARAEGLGEAMLQAAALAHRTIGLPVGNDDLVRAAESPAVARLDFLLLRFFAGRVFSTVPALHSWAWRKRYSFWLRLYRLALKNGRRYRMIEIARVWISPADRSALRLPPALSVLYPVLRPVGWLVRRCQP
jgi:hypothetical protein